MRNAGGENEQSWMGVVGRQEKKLDPLIIISIIIIFAERLHVIIDLDSVLPM